jgi:hypothetical protein
MIKGKSSDGSSKKSFCNLLFVGFSLCKALMASEVPNLRDLELIRLVSFGDVLSVRCPKT